jgi:hypothetical protein
MKDDTFPLGYRLLTRWKKTGSVLNIVIINQSIEGSASKTKERS